MTIVTEGETAYLTVVFTDAAGDPEAPTGIQYRIDDLSSGEAILALTTFAPPASEIQIILLPEHNRILNPALRHETRRVTVVASYGAGAKAVRQYDYKVRQATYYEHA